MSVTDESMLSFVSYELAQPIHISELRMAFVDSGESSFGAGRSLFVNTLKELVEQGRVVVLAREKVNHYIVHVEPSGSEYLDPALISALDAAFRKDVDSWN